MITLAQWIGAIGIGLFYPIQNWRAFVTRKPIGLSFLAFCVITVGVAGYLALGIRLGTPIFFGLNASNLIFDFLLLGLIWLWSPALSRRERFLGLLVLGTGLPGLTAINLLLDEKLAMALSGWIGFAGILGFYPVQNLQLFIRRDPTGLSLTAFTSLFIGLCGLTAFGILIGNTTVILGNGLTAIGTLPILWAIIRWKKK